MDIEECATNGALTELSPTKTEKESSNQRRQGSHMSRCPSTPQKWRSGCRDCSVFGEVARARFAPGPRLISRLALVPRHGYRVPCSGPIAVLKLVKARALEHNTVGWPGAWSRPTEGADALAGAICR